MADIQQLYVSLTEEERGGWGVVDENSSIKQQQLTQLTQVNKNQKIGYFASPSFQTSSDPFFLLLNPLKRPNSIQIPDISPPTDLNRRLFFRRGKSLPQLTAKISEVLADTSDAGGRWWWWWWESGGGGGGAGEGE